MKAKLTLTRHNLKRKIVRYLRTYEGCRMEAKDAAAILDMVGKELCTDCQDKICTHPEAGRSAKAYMCATDFDIELPWNKTAEFPVLYRTIKALKKDRNCWRECGIVEVKVSFKRNVLIGNIDERKTRKKLRKVSK